MLPTETRRGGVAATVAQLVLVFGIDHSTAITYANLARQILTTGREPTASTASIRG